MGMDNIKWYLENLTLLMQESAEHGDMDSSVYSAVLALMGDLVSLLPGEVPTT